MSGANHFTRRGLADEGFDGFVTFHALRSGGISDVPEVGGVYVVLREADNAPRFLANNPGGRFKGKNPTVPMEMLEAKWIDGCHVIYIGKGDNLRRRVKEYMDFGSGKPVGHWGGRYIWQLEHAATLLVAWKIKAPDEAASSAEAGLIARFSDQYAGRLPFANIAGARVQQSATPDIASIAATTRKVPPAGLATSQRVTSADLRAGQVRFPRAAKRYFPDVRSEIRVELRGIRLEARYDPRTGPDRERSAVLRVGRANLERLVRPGDVLAVAIADGIVRLD
jgi:hypothetical protein